MTDVEYFRPSDIAELMRWSESHLANLRCHNEGPPFIKVRNRVLYSKVDFYRWLKEKHREQKQFRAAKKAAAA